MACIYIYKNHTFNSENELDDFIMDLLPFESKYGDLVFQVTVEQINIIDKVNIMILVTVPIFSSEKYNFPKSIAIPNACIANIGTYFVSFFFIN